MAICALQFHTVKTCLNRIEGSLSKGTDNDWNFRSIQGARNFRP